MPVPEAEVFTRRRRSTKRRHRLLPICAAFGAFPLTALAQSAAADVDKVATEQSAPAANTLDTVVITAERRVSTVQKAPLSITAVSGEKLKEQGITNVADLMRDIPGVNLKAGGTGQTEYTIRGLSSTAGVAPTVGFYLDDVSLSSPTVSSGGKSPVDPDLYDLARVEVLRGPQGTLYGASSMGGTIKLVPQPAKLNLLGGSVQVIGSGTEGGGANGTVNAALNIPLVEDIAAMRVVLTKKRLSGWIDRNTTSEMPIGDPDGTRGDLAALTPDRVHRGTNDTRLDSARVSMTIQPTDQLSITPSFLYQSTRLGAPDTFDTDPGCCKRYQAFDIAEPFKDQFSIGSVKAEYEFEKVTFTSITAYSKRKKKRVEDQTEYLQRYYELPAYSIEGGGLGPITNTEFNTTKQFTQEFRLTSNSKGPFRWILGAFYSRFSSFFQGYSDVSPVATNALFGTTDLHHQSIDDTLVQKAVFGNVSYDITEKLKITAGTRFFRSNARNQTASSGVVLGDAQHDERAASKGSTPMLNLSYDVSETSMAYATAAKGYREGSAQQSVGANCGPDLAALGRTEAPSRYNPDSVWSYEVGSKNRLFSNAVTLNASLYTQKWSGVQSFVNLPGCGYLFMDNAGEAQVNGFEIETAVRVGSGLTVNAAVGHTRAVFVRDDAGTATFRGQQLDGVSPWTGSLGVQYEQPFGEYRLMGNLGVSYTGRSKVNKSEPKVLAAYTLVDARIGLKANKWSATLFGDNLTNRHPTTNIGDSLLFTLKGLDRGATVRPRTFGVDVSYDF